MQKLEEDETLKKLMNTQRVAKTDFTDCTDFTDSLMETSTILTEGESKKKSINLLPKSTYKKTIRNAGRNRHFQNSPSRVKNFLHENYLASAKKGDKEKFIDSLQM